MFSGIRGSILLTVMASIAISRPLQAQTSARPALRAAALHGDVLLDGRLDDPAWERADSISELTEIEPQQGGQPSARTVVRVLASPGALLIGVRADDPDATRIVSFAKQRDADLDSEDHIRFVLDTFMDGRSGYIFAVNASGARYDALVANQGEGESSDWDAIWQAATHRDETGWSVEILIPVRSLIFREGLDTWGFNIQRRIERLQETSRWASPSRDFKVGHTNRAGLLTNLPRFELGIGLSVRPSLTAGIERVDRASSTTGTTDASLDLTQRLGGNLLSSVTINTDFAETEVDTRQTNLTRFSTFFPEKRTFFLEGADIFDFGLGLSGGFMTDLIPFFSRRIGLLEGTEVPLIAGGKVNGRLGRTNMGALVVRTNDVNELAPATTMGVVRVEQNVLEQSSVGMIATFGDPEGRADSWMAGVDATYQTSRFRGDKNFLIGVWGLMLDREDLTRDRTAAGFKIDYPNDTWDIALTYKRLGDDFLPSLGFIPRPGVQIADAGINYRYRPESRLFRHLLFELRPKVVLDLRNRWESYRLFMAPVNWQFESGDRFEFNWVPQGERLVEPFELPDSVVVPAGSYHFSRYRLEAQFAEKRRLSGMVTWWFGKFYDGSLHELELEALWNPWPLLTIEASLEHNEGELAGGAFNVNLVGTRLSINLSPDLQIASLLQYDDESDSFGSNTRLRWTFHPFGDLFLVYNHNLRDRLSRWTFDSNQLLLKAQYTVRY